MKQNKIRYIPLSVDEELKIELELKRKRKKSSKGKTSKLYKNLNKKHINKNRSITSLHL